MCTYILNYRKMSQAEREPKTRKSVLNIRRIFRVSQGKLYNGQK